MKKGMKRWGSLLLVGILLLSGCAQEAAQPSPSSGGGAPTPSASQPVASPPAATPTPITWADTVSWDAAYDVVVIGFGGAGGVSAITAADEGAQVLILEKAPKGDEGGNTRYAGQFVGTITEEEYDAGVKYFKALRNGFDTVSDEMVEWFVSGLTGTKEWLVSMGMKEDSFCFPSSEHPELANGFKVTCCLPQGDRFTDEFNGEYWNLVRRNVVERSDMIDVWYDSPAVHLLQDPVSKTIVGVEAQRDGQTYRIRARNGVIMACGGFENNEEMIECYTQNNELYPIGTLYNTGDGIRMAMEVNANLWHMGAISGPFIGYTTEDLGEGRIPFETMDKNVTAGLSMINVGPDGKRFTDESQKTRHGHVYYNGEYAQQYLYDTMYAIFDEETRLAGPIYKGYSKDNSEELAKGILIRGDTIAELAGKIGLDPDVLTATVEEYNQNCADGYDPYFNRPVEKLVPIGEGPYYALKLEKGLINTQGGAERNENCEVLDLDGNVIPNLYSAGEFGSIFSDIYQGGCNLAETIISGTTAGKNAAVKKGELPTLEQGTAVEQKEVGRLTFPEDADAELPETGENEFIGVGTGVSDITVKIKLEDGVITAVDILDEHETDGISDAALAEMPGRIVEAGSADGVDTVSGATKTSKWILEAVRDALSIAGN